jgi:hypothetical protein
MADTIDTRPGVVPADLKTGPDGAVPDLGGRRAWIWCRGPLGDRSDFRSDRLEAAARRGYKPVGDYLINFGESARPGKARTVKGDDSPPAELAGTFDDGGAATGTVGGDTLQVDVPEAGAQTGTGTDDAEPATADPAAEPDGDADQAAATTTTRKGRATK